MSDADYFQARTRLKAVRSIIRKSEDLDSDPVARDAVIEFLEDLAEELSRQAAYPDHAFFFVVECMKDIVDRCEYGTYRGEDDHGGDKTPCWSWPVINTPPPSGSAGFTGTFRDYSALKMFGYTVGKTEGWPQSKREAFLADFMELDLPPIVEATFGDEYGEPMSTTRLRKMANLIATNATNFYRNDPIRYRVAIADWDSDLEFLKRRYYIGAGLAFQPWPSSRPE